MKTGQQGFSITELLVVVSIIAALAVLGMPRFRKFQAQARKAEAITNLSTIHKLQILHQQGSDNYASWLKTDIIGYDGTNTSRKCNFGSAASNDGQPATGDGAYQMGFRPSGCETMRYGYWVLKGTKNAREHFLAIAYAPSNEDVRLFPTCDGAITARANLTVTHKDSVSGLTFTTGNKKGDLMAIDDYKDTGTYNTQNNDIIYNCTR